jgi:hypothetical protein
MYSEQVKLSDPVFDTPDCEEVVAIEPLFNQTLSEKRHFANPGKLRDFLQIKKATVYDRMS